MIFSGMSGAAVADAAGFGMIEIKAMKDNGYDWRFSAAITAASSTIGPVIPPSIPLVIYGFLTEVSVSRLFLAGVILCSTVVGSFCPVFAKISNKIKKNIGFVSKMCRHTTV